MQKISKIFFAVILLFSLFFASWYALNGDIIFSSDNARDFHLLRELDEKKIILIGARSSSGLFHGPLWIYLNYPAYVLGGGNPVVVAWFWVVLCVLFVVGNYFIARDLFGKTTAIFYTTITAITVSFFARNLYNNGAMFVIPLFFFLFIKYHRTQKLRFLISNLLIGGLILQFQLALGVPFLILSSGYFLYSTIKSGRYKRLLAFLLFPFMIINFILFDLRHNFLYLNKLFSFITPQVDGKAYNYSQLIADRFNAAFNTTGILRHDAPGFLNALFFITAITFCLFLIKKNKNRDIYQSFFYFYFGFFILSFINKGPMLYFYTFPIVPLTLLIISSFLKTKYKSYVYALLVFILLINFSTGMQDIKASGEFFGKNIYSWKFLNTAADKVFAGNENEFGYFVYAADTVAYDGKYAMYYAEKTHINKKIYYFTKKPITYLLIAPTPVNKSVTGDAFWTKQRLKINKKPIETIKFENGYKIEKYELTDEEIKIPFDKEIDPGLHFR